MIRLAGQAISLLAAMALTLFATAALTGIGSYTDIVWPAELPAPFYLTAGHPECICFGRPPPPLPKFLHPRAVRMKPPEILCEVPGDPTAVTACAARSDQALKPGTN